MVTPGQFDDAEEKEVVESKADESADQEKVEQIWREAEERLFGDEDSDGDDFIDEYVEVGKGALHSSNHPNQQVWNMHGNYL